MKGTWFPISDEGCDVILYVGFKEKKMQFKKGIGWKACYDEEKNTYTAQRSWRGFYQLCEIDAEIYDKLGNDDAPDKLIGSGRVLFESDDDYYCPPHYAIYDEDYNELAPWSSAKWIAGKTDALNKKNQIVEQFPGLALAYGSSDEGGRTQYYGVSDMESSSLVDQETIFPACSISKFVTAICVEIAGIKDVEYRLKSQWISASVEASHSKR